MLRWKQLPSPPGGGPIENKLQIHMRNVSYKVFLCAAALAISIFTQIGNAAQADPVPVHRACSAADTCDAYSFNLGCNEVSIGDVQVNFCRECSNTTAQQRECNGPIIETSCDPEDDPLLCGKWKTAFCPASGPCTGLSEQSVPCQGKDCQN